MKFLRDESGQMLVLTALSMTALLGFVALSTDVGMLFHTRRNLQIAADAAATAAALDDLDGNGLTSNEAAGQAAATANGVTNGVNGATVVVDNPATGYHTGSGYFEAMVTVPNPTFFMKVFNIGSMNVSARAVAGLTGITPYCIWLMGDTGTDFALQGSGTITGTGGTNGCGIYVNSSSSDAVDIKGNGNTVNVSYLNVVGGETGSGSANGTVTTLGAPAQSSPFASLTPANPSTACTSGNTITTTTYSGTFNANNGIECFSKNVDVSGATLENGLFLFEGNVSVGVGATTTVTNGTIDINSGTFTQGSGQSLVNVVAPTSGTYNGIAILQPATNTNALAVQFGSSNQTLDGYIVAPGAVVTLHDHGGGITATGLVALSLALKTSTITIPSYSAAHPTTTPLQTIALVE